MCQVCKFCFYFSLRTGAIVAAIISAIRLYLMAEITSLVVMIWKGLGVLPQYSFLTLELGIDYLISLVALMFLVFGIVFKSPALLMIWIILMTMLLILQPIAMYLMYRNKMPLYFHLAQIPFWIAIIYFMIVVYSYHLELLDQATQTDYYY